MALYIFCEIFPPVVSMLMLTTDTNPCTAALTPRLSLSVRITLPVNMLGELIEC